jgi:hypothetical protein
MTLLGRRRGSFIKDDVNSRGGDDEDITTSDTTTPSIEL